MPTEQVSPLGAHGRTAFLRAPADPSSAHPPHRCKKKVPASKRFTIHRTSNVLTLSLKRFANFSGGKITKVSLRRGVRPAWLAAFKKYRLPTPPQSQ